VVSAARRSTKGLVVDEAVDDGAQLVVQRSAGTLEEGEPYSQRRLTIVGQLGPARELHRAEVSKLGASLDEARHPSVSTEVDHLVRPRVRPERHATVEHDIGERDEMRRAVGVDRGYVRSPLSIEERSDLGRRHGQPSTVGHEQNLEARVRGSPSEPAQIQSRRLNTA